MGQAQVAPVQQEPEFHTDLPVGEVLRRARLHYGQSLKDVERNIRIRASQIEAIETGHYENLPGRVYAIGFVRSYAEYLGLDGSRVVALFKAQASGNTVNPALHFPVPASESKLPSRWVVTGCIAATVLLCLFWWANADHGREMVKTVPPVPAKLAQQAGVGEITEGEDKIVQFNGVQIPQESENGAAMEESGAEASMPAQLSSQTVVETQEAGAPVVSAPPTAETQASKAPAVSDEGGITLNIIENSWVEIRDQNNQIIVSKVLKEGDQYFVPSRPDLSMALGNAAGVQVTIGGRALPPLGERGEVKRDISLDADKLRTALEDSQN